MGVEFFPCHYCGRSVCDAGDYIRCNEDCYNKWCSDECAEEEGHRIEKEEDEEYESEYSCNFCRSQDLEDYELVDFLLEQIGWSRGEAVSKYNAC